MNRDGLCKVAEEINKELGASIKVNTKSTFAGLMEGIKHVVENFEGKAVLSQKTIDFLCEKEIDVPAQIKVKTKKAPVQKTKVGKVLGKEKVPTNKALLYQAWKAGETDIKKLSKIAKGKVNDKSIAWYISRWKHGYSMPIR